MAKPRLLLFILAVTELVCTSPAIKLEPLPEIRGRDFDLQRFEREFVQQRRAVVIKGFLLPALQKLGDSPRETLAKMCGSRPLIRTCETASGPVTIGSRPQRFSPGLAGDTWAGLENADPSTTSHLNTIGDVFAAQDTHPNDPVMLHQAPIHRFCPDFFSHAVIPSKFFPFDFWTWVQDQRGLKCPEPMARLATGEPHEPTVRTQYPGWDLYDNPAISIGNNGTGTSVHIEPFGLQSWLVAVEGVTEMRIFREEDSPFLSPRRTVLFEPVETFRRYGLFEADVFAPDFKRFPFLASLRGWQVNLTRGDVLYLPAGFPHATRNHGNTITYGSKYVDAHNLDYHNQITYTYAFEKKREGDDSRVLIIPSLETEPMEVPEPLRHDDNDGGSSGARAEGDGSATEADETDTGTGDLGTGTCEMDEQGGCVSSKSRLQQLLGVQHKSHGDKSDADTASHTAQSQSLSKGRHNFFGVYYNTGTEMFLQIYASHFELPGPAPDLDWETFNRFVYRQHPLQVIQQGNNRAVWKELTGGLDFVSFFREWPGTEMKNEDDDDAFFEYEEDDTEDEEESQEADRELAKEEYGNGGGGDDWVAATGQEQVDAPVLGTGRVRSGPQKDNGAADRTDATSSSRSKKGGKEGKEATTGEANESKQRGTGGSTVKTTTNDSSRGPNAQADHEQLDLDLTDDLVAGHLDLTGDDSDL